MAQLEQARKQYAVDAFDVRAKEEAPGFIRLRVRDRAGDPWGDRWAEIELGTGDAEVLQQLLASERKKAEALGVTAFTFVHYLDRRP